MYNTDFTYVASMQRKKITIKVTLYCSFYGPNELNVFYTHAQEIVLWPFKNLENKLYL